MNKHLTFVFLTLICLTVFGQNALELNKQSKELIEAQEFNKAVPDSKTSSGIGKCGISI